MTNRVSKFINNKYIDQTYKRFIHLFFAYFYAFKSTNKNTSGRLFSRNGTFSMTYKYAHNSFFQHPLK